MRDEQAREAAAGEAKRIRERIQAERQQASLHPDGLDALACTAEQERLWLAEQARKAREAGERRSDTERQGAADRNLTEAERAVEAGERLSAEGMHMEALSHLERAWRPDTPNDVRARAGMAVMEALAALGLKAKAMKRLQEMKELGLVPQDRKRMENLLKKLI